jgi:glycerol dehydrogenase-like iron-containing ADH family enzyme
MDMWKHFDKKHDAANKRHLDLIKKTNTDKAQLIEKINKNNIDIAVTKTKQVAIAAAAGLGGGQIPDGLKFIYELLKKSAS